MKTKVIIITPEGPRVLTNPEEAEYREHLHVVNPDLSKVEHLPPHKWSLGAYSISPASPEEVSKNEQHAVSKAKQEAEAAVGRARARLRRDVLWVRWGVLCHYLVILMLNLGVTLLTLRLLKLWKM